MPSLRRCFAAGACPAPEEVGRSSRGGPRHGGGAAGPSPRVRGDEVSAANLPGAGPGVGAAVDPAQVAADGDGWAAGHRAGRRAGARALAGLGLSISRSRVLRVLMTLPIPPTPTPTVLSIDDVALRRGHRYATVLIDAVAHRRIDVLPDRKAATLTTWPREHPGAEILCRDGSAAYAEAIRQGAHPRRAGRRPLAPVARPGRCGGKDRHRPQQLLASRAAPRIDAPNRQADSGPARGRARTARPVRCRSRRPPRRPPDRPPLWLLRGRAPAGRGSDWCRASRRALRRLVGVPRPGRSTRWTRQRRIPFLSASRSDPPHTSPPTKLPSRAWSSE